MYFYCLNKDSFKDNKTAKEEWAALNKLRVIDVDIQHEEDENILYKNNQTENKNNEEEKIQSENKKENDESEKLKNWIINAFIRIIFYKDYEM